MGHLVIRILHLVVLVMPMTATLVVGICATAGAQQVVSKLDPVGFEVKVDVVLQRDKEDWCWIHPRAAVIPNADEPSNPKVLMTLSREVMGESDFFSGTYVMQTADHGKLWAGPDLFPQLDWWKESDEALGGVIDVTPGWHPQTGKVIAMGIRVRYDLNRENPDRFSQLQDKRPRLAAYAVYDPKSDHWKKPRGSSYGAASRWLAGCRAWRGWQILELPEEEKYFRNAVGSTQWVVKPDGDLLVPVAHSKPGGLWSVTVMQFKFDGEEMRYAGHGNELRVPAPRGLIEPSLIEFQGRYYLTLRNPVTGYVTSSDDGLHFGPIKPWKFDDGAELGNSKTQQHWLAHARGLFLVYTRRGANNDHVVRHRAPLFIAQVDPAQLCVARRTERILIPNHGAPMGNFGATQITENESWVTVSELMWPTYLAKARKQGAAGRTFVARVMWTEPNR